MGYEFFHHILEISWYLILFFLDPDLYHFCLDPDPYQISPWIRIRIKMIRIRHTAYMDNIFSKNIPYVSTL